MKQVLCAAVLAVVLSSNVAAGNLTTPVLPENLSTSYGMPEENQILYSDQRYTVFDNKLIDTYFIACGLFFDFECDWLFSEDMNIDYTQTKEYFAPYGEHPFILNLNVFVDAENKYVHLEALDLLTRFVISKTNTGLGLANIQSELFKSDEEFYNFLEGLYAFYYDTDAENFFKSSVIHKSQTDYISEHAADVPVDDLLAEMENYAGNKQNAFGGSNVHYYSLVSIYKSPYNATFHYVGMNSEVFLTSVQSPLGYGGDFDFRLLFETSQHESLHLYINFLVEARSPLIESLAAGKNSSDYTGTNRQYVNIPWHRIVDEAFVRVIQARIYGTVYGNFDLGYQQILAKETQNGFQNLDGIYQALSEYENNRDDYPAIDGFIVELINIYLM